MRRDLRTSRRSALAIALMLALLPFQNCTQFTSNSETDSPQTSLGSGLPINPGPNGVAPTPTPTATPMGSDPYKASNTPPVMSADTTALTILSGMGPLSGNVSVQSGNITLTSKGGTKPNKTVTFNCEIPTKAPYAFSVTAVDSTMTRVDASKDFFEFTGCGTVFQDIKKFTLKVKSGRCMAGTMFVKVSAVDEYDARADAYIPVTVSNACKTEVRLRTDLALDKLDEYGGAVAFYNGKAVVLAPGDDGADNTKNKAGAAYLFTNNGTSWQQKQVIYVSDIAASDYLSSVAMNDSWLILGSGQKASGAGAVYIFSWNGTGWVEGGKISGASAGQAFGKSLALKNNTLIVGAPGDSSGGPERGSVYVYNISGGTATEVTHYNGSANYGGFGTSVAYDGSRLIVGAPQSLLHESEGPGNAFVADVTGGFSGVTLSVLARGTEVQNGAKFGWSVATGSGAYLVGCPWCRMSKKGSAYYYQTSTGAEIRSPLDEDNGEYGIQVEISSRGLFVSGRGVNQTAGAVDLYTTSRVLIRRLFALNSGNLDQFGYSFSSYDNQILVGARLKSDPNDQSGAAYLLNLP